MSRRNFCAAQPFADRRSVEHRVADRLLGVADDFFARHFQCPCGVAQLFEFAAQFGQPSLQRLNSSDETRFRSRPVSKAL